MHPLYGALPVPCGLHEMLWSHIRILMRLHAAEPREHRRTFIPVSVSLWNDLVFDGVGLAGSKSRPIFFQWPMLLARFFSSTVSLSHLSFYRLVLWSWGLRIDGV